MHKVPVKKAVFGDPKKLVLIAGPCVIETEKMTMAIARSIAKTARELKLPFVFKASFDKANRSSIWSFRGPGLEKGLKTLAKVKKEFGVPVVTDIHSAEQAGRIAEVADILQVPAFLCRQTDLIAAAARTGRVVNVKKGQFLSPWEVKNIIHKLEECGTKKILITERGTSFGYNTLVNDFRGIGVMRGFGYPVVFDATHSVQVPGGTGGKGTASGGLPEFIPLLARCAVVSGADAVFMEVHPDPDQAACDGPCMLPLQDLEGLLTTLQAVHKAVQS